MAKHYNIFLLLLTVYCLLQTAHAQNPDIKRTYNWYFGANAGLNFSSGAPAALTNGQLVSDNSATISDTAGNLLFYTDGKSIWNKNNLVMPNGTGLNGDSYAEEIIVPQPSNDSLYYVFNIQLNPTPPDTLIGFQYSVVNMKLNGGTGDVIIKNYHVLDTCWERIAAVKHANGNDIWIAVMKAFTNKIYCYLLTSAGLNTNPVINSIGRIDMNGATDFKFSASGKKLALPVGADSVEIFDFSNSTGMLSNLVKVKNTYVGTYEAPEFSPDETKLYLSYGIPVGSSYPNGANFLYQIDITSSSQITINSSLTFIDTICKTPGSGIQRASDGKIYLGRAGLSSLGRINNPNASSGACNYDTNAVNLLARIVGEAMPKFINSYFYDSTLLAGINQVSGIRYQVSVYPNPSTGIVHINCANTSCNNGAEISSIQITNMLGQVVLSPPLEGAGEAFDLSNLSNGMYIIEIISNGNSFKQKIIINK